MGSDTCGSIRIPAAVNNLVGLRPTKGISSIDGIVPLSITQDTAGPLARTVADLALVLDATMDQPKHATFTTSLQTATLKDVRIGTLEPLFGDNTDDTEVIKLTRAAIDDMKKQGAIIVPIPLPELQAAIDGTSVIALEFKEDLAAYLATQPQAPIKTLDDIVNNGLIHTALEATMKTRVSSKGRNSADYKLALAKRAALQQLILKVMEDNKLDALAYPTLRRKPARINDPQAGSTCALSASTGFPAISMPAGFTADGLPVALELFGRPEDDAKLVSYTYAYEQATHHRRAPARTPALSKLTPITWQSSNETLQANLTLSNTQLAYTLTTTIPKEDILAATIHRKSKDATGPILFVIASRNSKTLEGTIILSDPDRGALQKGDLYLRLTTRTGAIRLDLKPN